MSDSSGQIAQFGAHLIKDAQWQVAPDAISWWPATTFWSVLFYSLLLVLLAFFIRRTHQWLQRTYIRQTAQLFAEYDAQNNLPNIATLMRQFAHQHWPNEAFSTLSAQQFSARIVTITPDVNISSISIESLLTFSYKADPQLDESDRDAIRTWFKAVTC